MAAAMKLFDERGYDDTTVEDIADAAEVSPRTFYRLFPAKADVIVEKGLTTFGDLVSAVADRPAGEPLQASIEAVFVAQLADLDAKWLRTFEDLMIRNPDLLARWLQRLNHQQGELAAVIARRQGMAADDLQANILAAIIMASIRTALEVWSRHPGKGGPIPTLCKTIGLLAPILDR